MHSLILFVVILVFIHAASFLNNQVSSTGIYVKIANRKKRYIPPQRSNRLLGYGTKIEELISSDIYHKYIRPGVNSGKPLNVSVSLAVNSLDKISDANMEYTMTFTLYQTWRDDRLDETNPLRELTNPITMDASVSSRLWTPDTYIVNAKKSFVHDVTTKNGLVILYPNGTITYVLRITSQVGCPMKLSKYPMDQQTCKLRIASWSFTTADLTYRWTGELKCDKQYGSITGMNNVVLPQFNLTSCSIYATNHKRLLGNYSELVMEFRLKRNLRFFFLQNYVPAILLVALSWVSFLISPNAVPARVALGITTILSMTTLMIGLYNGGPKSTSYVKAIDLYSLVCYAFIFIAMFEYAFLHFKIRSHEQNDQKKSIKEKKVVPSLDNKVDELKENDACTVDLKDGTKQEIKDESDHVEAGKHSLKNELNYALKAENLDFLFLRGFPMAFGLFNFVYWIAYLSS